MRRSLHIPRSSPLLQPNRRAFMWAATATMFSASRASSLVGAFASQSDQPLKIEAVELIELHGRYTEMAGINRQQQVNPLDIYDDLRPAPNADKPSGSKEVLTAAVYLRIRTAGGPEGLYGPIEKDAALIVNEDLRPFL